MSWIRFLLPAVLLALILAACTTATSGPAVNSELGGLRKVHIVKESAAGDRPDGAFLIPTPGLNPGAPPSPKAALPSGSPVLRPRENRKTAISPGISAPRNPSGLDRKP